MASQGQKIEDSAPINDFNNHYQFLNNDHSAWVMLEGAMFPSAAVAYQAARTDDVGVRQQLSEVETYERFKEIAMGISNPLDWNGKRLRVMERIVRDKFKRSKELGGKLVATFPRTLINTFKQGGENEQFWGVVAGKGANNLGKILMKVREEMQKGLDSQLWIKDQGVEEDNELWPTLSLLVIKEQTKKEKLFLENRSKFFFGRQEGKETKEYKAFKLDHPSISKIHACIYFGYDLSVMLVDMGSSNGTSITRDEKTFKLEPLKPIALEKDDLIAFGNSSRSYKVELDLSKVEGYYLKCQKEKIQLEMKRAREKERYLEREREREREREKEREREREREKEERRSRSRSRSPKHRKHRN